ncbi:hypothetical protein [Achromobacter sp. K91]|nr:hypothetical protein [Achromobacter sp. K91]
MLSKARAIYQGHEEDDLAQRHQAETAAFIIHARAGIERTFATAR